MAPAPESPAEAPSSKPSEDARNDRSPVVQQQDHLEPAAVHDHPDHDDANGDSNRRSQKSPRKPNKRTKKRSVKHKASLTDHEQIIRDHIDTLKNRLREQGDDPSLSETIDTLEGLSSKLKNAPLAEPKSNNGLSSNETVTMLHFFYIVRLAQQGFFSVISSSFPNIEIDAIVYLCDKLVGSSLFAVKDASEHVRQAKHNDVFDLLRKLHSGANQAVGEGFQTTFRQMKDMIRTLIESSLSQAQNNTPSTWPLAPANAPPPTTQHCAPPVWLVVPFNSMIDMSALSLYQNNDIKVAEPSVPDIPSEAAPIATEETMTPSSSPQTQEDDQQTNHGSEGSITDKDDDNQSRSSARGRGRGRGYGRGRGRGEGGGRGYRGSFRGRGGGFYRSNSRGAWSPRGG